MTVTPAGHPARIGAFAMKKALPILAALLLSWSAGAADAALLALAPAASETVIAIDAKGLLENPELNKLAAKPEAIKLLAEVERSGMRCTDVREIAVFNWDDCWYGLFRLNDANAFRRALEEHRKSGKTPLIVPETAGGRQTFRLRDPKRQSPKHIRKEMCLTFLDDGTVVLAKAKELPKFLTAKRMDPAAAAKLAARHAEVWLEYRQQPGGGDRKKGGGEVFDVRLKQASLELKFAGDAKKDLDLRGTAEFVDAEGAKSMSMTLPGIVSFFAGLIFSEDPEGGDMLVRALRTEVRGNTLHLSLHAGEELCSRFIRALDNFCSEKDDDDDDRPAARSPLPGGRRL